MGDGDSPCSTARPGWYQEAEQIIWEWNEAAIDMRL